MASTCVGSFFDTQVSIYSGSCGRLYCVAGNDQGGLGCGNGDQSTASWFAESSLTYYIYVHGYRSSKGLFSLTVDRMEDNNEVQDAIQLFPYALPTFGSTNGATIKTGIASYCGSAWTMSPGVWFYVVGNGEPFVVSVLTEYSSFRGQVSIFRRNSFDELECVGGSYAGYHIWSSEDDVKYLILVNSQDTEGDFRVQVGRAEDIQPRDAEVVGNVFAACEAAEMLIPGLPSFNSTEGAPRFAVGSCGSKVFSTGPGLWYQISGTGGVVRVSTCVDDNASKISLDSQISVFGGSCDNLQCIDGNDQAGYCGDQSAVSWVTKEGELYYILGTCQKQYMFSSNTNPNKFSLQFMVSVYAKENSKYQ